jgi:hypothetical protein
MTQTSFDFENESPAPLPYATMSHYTPPVSELNWKIDYTHNGVRFNWHGKGVSSYEAALNLIPSEVR